MANSKWWSMVVLVAVMVASTGCTIQYKLKAKGWGEQIKKAVGLVQEVQGAAQAAGMNAGSAAFRNEQTPKLDEARGILTTVQAELEAAGAPGSLKEAHENLKNGVALMIEGIDLFGDALRFADMSKGQKAKSKFDEGQAALVKARTALTGG